MDFLQYKYGSIDTKIQSKIRVNIMKTSILRLCFIFLIASLCNEAIAGTIKGTISYTGAATGQVLLVASTDSTFANGPKASVLLDSLGSYSLINLSDGEYFILSTMTN